MEVKAVHRYARISPQKVRMLVDSVKGKSVGVAVNVLKFLPQKSAYLVKKIIYSAVANADHNTSLNVDKLVVKNIIINQGPTLKRFKARARGRGSRILKRTSHITVILQEKSV